MLFVLPPLNSSGSEQVFQDVLSTLAHADHFRFRAAVLDSKGTLTAFTDNFSALQQEFKAAATAKGVTSYQEWVRIEEKAYLALRHMDGRRVIVRLFSPENPNHSMAKTRFAYDYSMDTYAALDGAQVYRLLQPVGPGAIIPFGEAASEPQACFGSTGLRQRDQVEESSRDQSAHWATKATWNLRTSGRAEETAKGLIEDVIRDNAATYRLTIQPSFACPDAARFRPVHIAVMRNDVHLFSPTAIQMIPLMSKPDKK